MLVNIDLKTHVGRIDVAKGQPIEARNHWFDNVEVSYYYSEQIPMVYTRVSLRGCPPVSSVGFRLVFKH
jgi:hypothetical protein